MSKEFTKQITATIPPDNIHYLSNLEQHNQELYPAIPQVADETNLSILIKMGSSAPWALQLSQNSTFLVFLRNYLKTQL